MRSPANKSNKSQVDKFIDTSYDKVAIVADNLDAILAAEDNIENTLRYLGTSSGIPLTRLDGSPIQDSDYYLDTTTKSFFYYVEISDEWIESDTEGVEQSAEEARLSAEAALISETNAAASESLVEAHKDAAGISEGNALLSEQLAHDWAEKADDTDVTDVGTRSAKHHANAAKASADLTNANVVITNADAASTNADALSTASDVIATNLDVGITNANVLLTNADVVTTHDDVVISTSNKDATNADVISTNADALLASTSRDEAELAKIAAGESEINSAASESNAATSETNAKNSEDNASAHESASLLSRDAAALSEANAKSSEISASNSKTSASNSKDSASLSEANASTSESNALQSATESGLARDESVSAKDIAVNAKDSAQLSESNAAVSESNASDSEANSLNYYNLTEASKDAAESAASTAAAHANFDGLWINTGTKAVSIPYAVEHADAIWMLVNPAGLSDISTSEPSVVNTDWSQIGSTGGTATDAARLANQLPSYYLDPDNHDDSISVNKWITQGEKDHLGTIETGATADQTASEIEGLYEGQANTNKFTDLDKALVSTSLQSVRAGTNVVINGGDPINPVISVIPSSSVGNTARSYFTGDVESVGAGNFLLASQVDKGTVAEVSQQVSVDDLQKSYFGQDFLGAVLPAMRVVVGTYTAGISVQYSSSSAHIKFYYEIYLADADGNVIDSGIASESVGDLGVRPLNVLTSGSTELPAGDIRNVPVTGTLSEPYDFPEGHRIRHHFAAEKLNTAGGVVNIDLFSGSNHNSYVDNNIPIDSDNLTNVSGVTGASVSDALESLDNNISTKADSSHTHIKSDIIDFSDSDYATSVQGTKADTALQPADNISLLTNDANYITVADTFSGSYDDLSDVPAEFVPATHTHVESEITDLDKYTKAEVDAKESSLQTSIGTKADSSHTHVKSEITDFNEGDYATSAQGAKADSALQSGDNVSELVNDSGFITNADLPPSSVVSVNGESGVVVLDASDVGALPSGGKAVDSDKLDNLNSTQFMRSDTDGSGTNSYSTTANTWQIGKGSGSVAMTTNDGGGNANITFNHAATIPDFSGNAGRIALNTDANTSCDMLFYLAENVTQDVGIAATAILSVKLDGVNVLSGTLKESGQRVYSPNNKPSESDIAGLDKYTQAEVDAQISLLSRDNPNNQTGTGYTLQLADQNKTVWRNNAGANTVTIPSNATIALPVNSLILVMMEGAGVTTVQAASGVTLNGVSAGSGVLERYIGVTLVKRGTNNWIATPLEVS